MGRTIPAYSIAAAVGIIAAVFYTKKRVRQDRFADLDRYLELEIAVGLAGTALGAKLLYLVIECGSLFKDIRLYGILKTGHAYLVGGFVFYGGLIGCFTALYLFCRSSKVSFAHSLQLVLPAFPLAHSFGRIGCLITGCCYGKETNNLLHIIYNHSQFAPNGVSLFPVQLVEALYELVLFFVLYNNSNQNTPGDIMLCKYAQLYGAGRFILEFYRGDECRGFIGVISVSQVLSMIIIAMSSAYILYTRKR